MEGISPGFWRGTREEFRIDQRQLATMAGVPQSGVAGRGWSSRRCDLVAVSLYL
jgi:hypothetical protein